MCAMDYGMFIRSQYNTGDDMVAAMDTVGVDAAILVSPWTMYWYDES